MQLSTIAAGVVALAVLLHLIFLPSDDEDVSDDDDSPQGKGAAEVAAREIKSAAKGADGATKVAAVLSDVDLAAAGYEAPGEEGGYPRLPAAKREPGAPVYTFDGLLKFNGADRNKPLLLAVVGEVYDVGPGEQFYAPSKDGEKEGGGYQFYAGCDCSKGFSSEGSEMDHGLTPCRKLLSKIVDMKPESVKDILDWRDFYRKHEKYRFVGFLQGRYFDARGARVIGQLDKAEEIYLAAQDLDKVREDFESRFKACNIKNTQADAHIEIWCDDSYHPVGSVPTYMYFRLQGQSEEKGKCVCITPSERKEFNRQRAKPVVDAEPRFRFVPYSDCPVGSQRCLRSKTAAPPSDS